MSKIFIISCWWGLRLWSRLILGLGLEQLQETDEEANNVPPEK